MKLENLIEQLERQKPLKWDKRFILSYANAHRGKMRKTEEGLHKLIIIEENCPRIPRRGWAAMIRKV
jgi:hypothetical protein